MAREWREVIELARDNRTAYWSVSSSSIAFSLSALLPLAWFPPTAPGLFPPSPEFWELVSGRLCGAGKIRVSGYSSSNRWIILCNVKSRNWRRPIQETTLAKKSQPKNLNPKGAKLTVICVVASRVFTNKSRLNSSANIAGRSQ